MNTSVCVTQTLVGLEAFGCLALKFPNITTKKKETSDEGQRFSVTSDLHSPSLTEINNKISNL